MLKWTLLEKPDSKEISCRSFENKEFRTLKMWRIDSAKQLNRHDKTRPFLKALPNPGRAGYIDLHQLSQSSPL